MLHNFLRIHKNIQVEGSSYLPQKTPSPKRLIRSLLLFHVGLHCLRFVSIQHPSKNDTHTKHPVESESTTWPVQQGQLWHQGSGSSKREPSCTSAHPRRLRRGEMSCSTEVAVCRKALLFASVRLSVGRPIIPAAVAVMCLSPAQLTCLKSRWKSRAEQSELDPALI